MADDLAQAHTGVWTRGLDVVMCLLPIIMLLLTTTVKRLYLPTTFSLPLAAVVMWVIRLAYLKLEPNYTNAAVVYGLFDALTPLSIIAGAITLFQAMEQTKCLPWIMKRVKTLSAGHPVAEVFLISWAFAYMIEGASGFGTPVALAAPLLVSLGHPPVQSIICCLIMNTLATVYGAVGTPLWFGFSGLGLSEDDLKDVGFRAEVMLAACAHIIPLIAASFLVPWKVLLRSWLFILLAIWSAILPAIGLSLVSTDFSSLLGGMVALCVTGALSAVRLGLSKLPEAPRSLDGERDPWGKNGSVVDSLNYSTAPPSGPVVEAFEGGLGRVSRSLAGVLPTLRTVSEPVAESSDPGERSQLGDMYIDYEPSTFEHSAAHTARLRESRSRSRNGSMSRRTGTAGSNRTVPTDLLWPYPTTELPPVATADDRMATEAGLLAYASNPLRGSRHHSGSGHRVSGTGSMSKAAAAAVTVSAIDEEKNGLDENDKEEPPDSDVDALDDPDLAGKPGFAGFVEGILRTMPLWLTVVLLLVTRIDALTLRDRFQRSEPHVSAYLGNLLTLEVSAWLKFTLRDFLQQPEENLVWSYAFLYIPFFIPFMVVSFVTIVTFHKYLPEGNNILSPFAEAFRRVGSIVPALLGSLVLVALIRKGSTTTNSPAYIIGFNLSDFMQEGFIAVSALLGALGSFFSGSTTVSNLTFGVVQQVAAEGIEVSVKAMLALQALGATAGNMICINNIISARAVVGGEAVNTSEGYFISKTGPVCVLMLCIGTAVAIPFLFL